MIHPCPGCWGLNWRDKMKNFKIGQMARENKVGALPFKIMDIDGTTVWGFDGRIYHIANIVLA